MSTSCPLPKFFAVKRDNGYKFYENKAFKPNDLTLINIVCNLNNIVIITINKYHRIERMNSSVLRKYYGGLNNDCSWTYAGYEFLLNNKTNDSLFHVPLIMIESSSETILPHGSDPFLPTDPVENSVSFPSEYELVDLFTSDPYELHTLPVASVVSQPQAARPQAAIPQAARPQPQLAQLVTSSSSSFPIHVKNIIIADSISKKECCPIAGIDIDRTNASVTSCGHVFTTEAIVQWLQMSTKKECPICKQKCSI
jgi:hypothetical protein